MWSHLHGFLPSSLISFSTFIFVYRRLFCGFCYFSFSVKVFFKLFLSFLGSNGFDPVVSILKQTKKVNEQISFRGLLYKRIICKIETCLERLQIVYFVTKRKKNLGYLKIKRNNKTQKPHVWLGQTI